MIGHVLKRRPRHDLEKISVVPGGKSRVGVIHVHASPDDLLKFNKRVTSFRPAGPVWCQVAGYDLWITRPRGIAVYSEEARAPAQIGRWIDRLRLGKICARQEFVRVLARDEIEIWGPAAIVATVAIARCVHYIAAEPDQRPVLANQIQRDWCYLKPPLDQRFLIVAIRVYARGTVEHSYQDDRTNCREGGDDLTRLCGLHWMGLFFAKSGFYLRHFESPFQ